MIQVKIRPALARAQYFAERVRALLATGRALAKRHALFRLLALADDNY